MELVRQVLIGQRNQEDVNDGYKHEVVVTVIRETLNPKGDRIVNLEVRGRGPLLY